MISAKEAKAQTEQNKLKVEKLEVETLIKKAIAKGRDSATFTGQMSEALKAELVLAGYEVNNGLIKW